MDERLGCGPGGANKIKEHAFFEDGPTPIDWDRLSEGNMTAPYASRSHLTYDLGEVDL